MAPFRGLFLCLKKGGDCAIARFELEAVLTAENNASDAIAEFVAELEAAQAAIEALDGESATVTLDVDDAGAREQIQALGADDQTVTIQVDADTAAAQGQIAALSGEQGQVTIQVDADTAAAQGQIAALSGEQGQVTIQVDADTAAAQGQIAALSGEQGQVTINVDADTGAAEAKIAALSGEQGQVTIQVDADTAAAEAKIAALATDDHKVTIQVDVDTAAAEAQIAALEASLQAIGRDVHINVDVDTGGAVANMAAAETEMTAMRAAGDALGGGMDLLGAQMDNFGTTLGVLVPLVALGVAAIEPLGAAITVVGSLATEAAVGMGLIGAAAVRMVEGVKNGEEAFVGLQTALTDTKAAFDGAFEPAAEQLAGLSTHVLELAQQAMPRLGEEASRAVDALSEGFQQVEQNAQQMGQTFDQIFASMPGVVSNLTSAFGSLGEGLLNVFSEAAPMAEEFSGYIRDIGQRFFEWSNSEAGRAQVRDFLEQARPLAEGVQEAVGQIGTALGKLDASDAQMVGDAIKGIGDFATGAIGVVDGLGDAWGFVKDQLNEVGILTGKQEGLWGELKEAGGSAAEWIGEKLSGMSPVLEEVGNKLRDIITRIASDAPSYEDSALGRLMTAAKDGVAEFPSYEDSKLGQFGRAIKEKLGLGGDIPTYEESALGRLIQGIKDKMTADIPTYEESALGKLIQGIKDKAPQALEGAQQAIQTAWDAIKRLFSGGEGGGEVFPAYEDSALGKLIEGIKDKAPQALEGAKTAIQTAWDAIKQLFSGEGGGGSVFPTYEDSALGKLIEGIKDKAPQALEGAKTAIQTAWDAIKQLFSGEGGGGSVFPTYEESALGKLIEGIKDKAPQALEAAKSAIQTAWDAIKQLFSGEGGGGSVFPTYEESALGKLIEGIKDKAPQALEAAKSAIQTAWDAIKQLFSGEGGGGSVFPTYEESALGKLIEGIKDKAPQALEAAKSAIQTAWDAIKQLFSGEGGGGSVFPTYEESALGKLIEGIKDKAPQALEAAKSAIQTAWDAIKQLFSGEGGGGSVFPTYEESALGKLIEGIKDKAGPALEAAKTTIQTAWDAIGELFKGGGGGGSVFPTYEESALGKFVKSVEEKVGPAFEKVKTTVTTAIEGIGTALSSIGEKLTSFGEDLAKIGDSAKKAAESLPSVGEALTTIAAGVVALVGMAAFALALEKVASAAEKAATPLPKVADALEKVGQNVSQLSGLDTAATALDKIATAAEKGAEPMNKMSEALQKVGEQAQKLTSLDTAATAFEKMGTAAQKGAEPMNKLSEGLQKVGESAQKLGPAMDQAAQSMQKLGQAAQQAMQQFQQAVEQGFEKAVQSAQKLDELKTQVETKLKELATTAQTSMTEFKTALETGFQEAAQSADKLDELKTQVETKLKELATTAKTSMEEFKQALEQGFQEATQAADKLDELKQKVEEKLKEMAEAAKTSMEEFKEAIKTGFDEAKEAVTTAMDEIAQSVTDKMTEITEAVTSGMDEIKQAFTDGMNEAKESVTTSMEAIVQAITDGMTKIAEAARKGMEEFKSAIQDGIQECVGIASEGGAEIGNALVDALVSTIQARAGEVAAAAADMVTQAVSAAKAAAGAASPSKVMMELGHDMMDGLLIPIRGRTEEAIELAQHLAEGISGAFDRAERGAGRAMDNLLGMGAGIGVSVGTPQPLPASALPAGSTTSGSDTGVLERKIENLERVLVTTLNNQTAVLADAAVAPQDLTSRSIRALANSSRVGAMDVIGSEGAQNIINENGNRVAKRASLKAR